EYLEIKVTASLSIFIVTLLVMLYLRDQQLKYLHQKIVQQKEEEIRGANHMVDELATLYNEVRGFRHDFGGIMSTMDSAIKAQDIEEVTKIYESVFEKMHQQISSSYYSGFNLGKIKEIGFRGVIANKMIQAKNNGIPFRLEVMQEVPPVNAPLLETVRILTILLDNALEATINARNPEVTLSLLVKNNQVVMIVKNTRDQKILIDGQKIWQRGYSTKGYNRGQGLANLSEICADLDSIDIETHISNSHFTQTIFFETRC
ncbi:GHKL domain-containing protein, partial [Granulicatella balaenopterae]